MSVVTKFEAYLLTEKRVSTNTFKAYKRDLEQFITFLKESALTLEQVRTKHLKLFLQHLKSMHLKSRSMSRKISTLKSFFSYAHEHAGFANYAQDLLSPKLEKRLPKVLSEQEIEKLLAVANIDQTTIGKRNAMILYLLYVTGMRISELVNLHISDIRFDTGFLSVVGKGNKQRMIPLPQSILNILVDYLQTVHKDIEHKINNGKPINFLFPTLYAGKIKRISRQSCWIIVNSLWEKTGIQKRISPHQLRHSLATHMLKNGVDLRSLQLILGHEKITTVQMYTHLEVSHLRTVYDKKHPRS